MSTTYDASAVSNIEANVAALPCPKLRAYLQRRNIDMRVEIDLSRRRDVALRSRSSTSTA
jgi:hypothetical protein